VRKKREIVIDDIALELEKVADKPHYFGLNESHRPRSLIYYPLIFNEKVIGVITVQSYRRNAYSSFQVETLRTLAAYVAIAFENGRLFEQVVHMASTDSLTGICNRHRFFELAETEFSRFKRYSLGFSLIMFDIDHFKLVNDKYGHSGGDKVLAHICEIATKCKREIDVFGRYGGEEFILLVPGTPLSGARDLAERLRAAFEGAETETDSGAIRCTASFGVAEVESGDASLSILVDKVDRNMYAAKESGRNRVCCDC
jgi:diguanylate cyclase (GGDEF)-like protein